MTTRNRLSVAENNAVVSHITTHRHAIAARVPAMWRYAAELSLELGFAITLANLETCCGAIKDFTWPDQAPKPKPEPAPAPEPALPFDPPVADPVPQVVTPAKARRPGGSVYARLKELEQDAGHLDRKVQRVSDDLARLTAALGDLPLGVRS